MEKTAFQTKLLKIKAECSESRLIAVTKNRPVEFIREGLDVEHFDYGENRVEELAQKASELDSKEVRFHFIGNLQSKKINKLLDIPGLYAIHSVDRDSLIEKIANKAIAKNLKLKIFLQVNTSGEVEKAGYDQYEALKVAAKEVLRFEEHLELAGLMTMSTLRTDDFEGEARRCFSQLKDWAEQLSSEIGLELQLSMGMSADYPIALEFGSDWVRVGSKLFS